MKKTKKALASLAIAGMTLSILPFNAFADATVPTRLAGGTAAQTAVAIANQTGWTGTAILASSASYGMVDALAAGPLAYSLKAPILLTGAGNTLDADTKAELTKLAVKTVYVTSGTAVISQAVLNELSGMGITVVPLGGVDRAATSVNIAKKMTGVTRVAVANSLQDALSIAAVASAANEPILLTDKNALPASVSAYLAANPGITSFDVIGGTGIISDAVKTALPGATRHAGNSAYDTNNKVIQDFSAALDFSNVYVANGVTGIDALAGAPLAAMTKSAIVLTDGTVPDAASFVHSKLTATSVVTALGGAAVVPETVLTGVVAGAVTPPTGVLSVTSVTVSGANSFKVVFNQAPTNTSNITFNVTNTGAPVTASATWDVTNTVATLSGSANFPEGTYVVAVKNGDADLGSSTLAITQQKIAKININSTKLAVTQDGLGYATFTVLDQYNNDITGSYLANNINFQTGVGTITVPSTGIIKLTPTNWKSTAVTPTNLLTFATVVVTAFDSSSGVSTSQTLNTSTAMGTLSAITLNKLTSSTNAVLTAGDTSHTWYIDYNAKDISGNDTKDYNLVHGGLILNTNDTLSCSNPNVTVKLVKDPNDTNKAAFEVTVNSTSLQMDMPVTITAMSYQGAPSSLSLTLKKQSSVETFTLMAPSYNIAKGEYKQIPFAAYDQNGTQLTKYTDIVGDPLHPNVTLTGFGSLNGVVGGFVQNPDGTVSLYVQATNDVTDTQSVPQILTAVTPTGKLSTITINIQPAVKADSLALDSSKIINAMQAPTTNAAIGLASSAYERVDFGNNFGGLTVNDQYGRPMDFTSLAKYGADGGQYQVVAQTTGTSIVLDQVDGKTITGNALPLTGNYTDPTHPIPSAADLTGNVNAISTTAHANGTKAIQIRSVQPGQQTVTFYLYDTLQKNSANATIFTGANYGDLTPIDTKSVTFSVVKDTDITGYGIQKVANPIYASVSTTGAITARDQDYEANPLVYGITNAGSPVVLGGRCVKGVYVDSSDFVVDTVNTGAITDVTGAVDGVYVAAKQLDPSKSSSSANLTVSILGADGMYHTATTPISSTTTDPVAKSLGVSVDQTVDGASLSDDGTTVYIKAGSAAATALAPGKYLTRFIKTDSTPTVPGAYAADGRNSAVVYFYATDSYGSKGMDLASINLNNNTTTVPYATTDNLHTKFIIDANGQITTNTLAAGDYVTVSAVSTSGLVQTIKIKYTN